MTATVTVAPTPPSAAGAEPQPPGAPPPDEGFAPVLEQAERQLQPPGESPPADAEIARTAVAEGDQDGSDSSVQNEVPSLPPPLPAVSASTLQTGVECQAEAPAAVHSAPAAPDSSSSAPLAVAAATAPPAEGAAREEGVREKLTGVVPAPEPPAAPVPAAGLQAPAAEQVTAAPSSRRARLSQSPLDKEFELSGGGDAAAAPVAAALVAAAPAPETAPAAAPVVAPETAAPAASVAAVPSTHATAAAAGRAAESSVRVTALGVAGDAQPPTSDSSRQGGRSESPAGEPSEAPSPTRQDGAPAPTVSPPAQATVPHEAPVGGFQGSAAGSPQADAPVQPAPAPAPARPHVPLYELPGVAGSVLRMAARDGAGSARITLHPAELGSVEIRIRYQASGVSAELTAESQQAAQALQQSVGELRRALESQGLTVLDLDVRSAADDTQPRWKRDGSEGEERSQGGFADGSAEVVLDPLHVLVGTHVNVLA